MTACPPACSIRVFRGPSQSGTVFLSVGQRFSKHWQPRRNRARRQEDRTAGSTRPARETSGVIDTLITKLAEGSVLAPLLGFAILP